MTYHKGTSVKYNVVIIIITALYHIVNRFWINIHFSEKYSINSEYYSDKFHFDFKIILSMIIYNIRGLRNPTKSPFINIYFIPLSKPVIYRLIFLQKTADLKSPLFLFHMPRILAFLALNSSSVIRPSSYIFLYFAICSSSES